MQQAVHAAAKAGGRHLLKVSGVHPLTLLSAPPHPARRYIGTWHLRGVSGGQRRRVSIGCELVTSPKLIFL